jgi:hypothetical protein
MHLASPAFLEERGSWHAGLQRRNAHGSASGAQVKLKR